MSLSQSSWSDSTPSHPGDTRTCAVLGCEKKHCFAEVNGRKIYSRYCSRRMTASTLPVFEETMATNAGTDTCERTISVEDGYHCPMAKDRDQKYCLNRKFDDLISLTTEAPSQC